MQRKQHNMKIGIVVVATNSYFPLGLRFINNWMRFYKGARDIYFHLFSDQSPTDYVATHNKIHIIHHETSHSNWVNATNSKFTNILSLENEDIDHIYYFDADTKIYQEFTEEWFIGDIVGGEHFGNPSWMKDNKNFERNAKSAAYVPLDTNLPQMYYLGAFFGGNRDEVIKMCNVLCYKQLKDKEIKFEPCWNDESYLNCYFHYYPPTRAVLFKDFKFAISDKGGIKETRNPNPKKDVQDVLDNIKQNKTGWWDISNGQFKLISENNIA